MKKFIFGLNAAVIVSTSIFTFAGCEKEENKTDNTKDVQKTACTEVVNPDESELLNRTYTVAIYDGEQFRLTFDPELFLHNLEEYLNTHSDEQYVAEDVSIYQSNDFDEPFLAVSCYDITNDESIKSFFMLTSSINEESIRKSVSGTAIFSGEFGHESTWSFQSDIDIKISCKSDHCNTPKKTGCTVEKAPDGHWRCSDCLYIGGHCEQTISSAYTAAVRTALSYSL